MVVFDSLEARELYFKLNPIWNFSVLKTLISYIQTYSIITYHIIAMMLKLREQRI